MEIVVKAGGIVHVEGVPVELKDDTVVKVELGNLGLLLDVTRPSERRQER